MADTDAQFKRVKHVMEALFNQGQWPSVRRVRDELGGGSLSTLSPLVKQVREQLIAERIPMKGISDEQLLAISSEYPEMRFEREAEGHLDVMPPTGGETGSKNQIIAILLGAWVLKDGTGISFDSSTSFRLPTSRAVVSPDFSWIPKTKWCAKSADERERYAMIAPDFVIELLSPTDKANQKRHQKILNKMDLYMREGVRLAWLIDPALKAVYVYEPGQPVKTLHNPATVSASPVMPGAVLDLSYVW